MKFKKKNATHLSSSCNKLFNYTIRFLLFATPSVLASLTDPHCLWKNLDHPANQSLLYSLAAYTTCEFYCHLPGRPILLGFMYRIRVTLSFIRYFRLLSTSYNPLHLLPNAKLRIQVGAYPTKFIFYVIGKAFSPLFTPSMSAISNKMRLFIFHACTRFMYVLVYTREPSAQKKKKNYKKSTKNPKKNVRMLNWNDHFSWISNFICSLLQLIQIYHISSIYLPICIYWLPWWLSVGEKKKLMLAFNLFWWNVGVLLAKCACIYVKGCGGGMKGLDRRRMDE